MQNTLDQAKVLESIEVESLIEFLKLPYWRQRNELYEVWILVAVLSRFRHYDIELGCISDEGRWDIPGNSQGNIDAPIATIRARTGVYHVFTGLRLKGFQFPFEPHAKDADIMPDWLFCREVHNGSFNFDLLCSEAERFRARSLVPELLIECKAGTSYRLIDTLQATMVDRYVPLLRTERSLAFLVNYRMFSTPRVLYENKPLRTAQRTKFRQVLALEQLMPGLSESYKTFSSTLDSFFRLDAVMDVVFLFDTTGSNEAYLEDIRAQLQDSNRALGDLGDVRTGAIAIGDRV